MITIVIGILLISVGAPLFEALLSKLTLDSGTKIISEDSMTTFSERYSQPFTLQTDQTCYIEFSNYSPNVTVYLFILTKNEYDYYKTLDGSNPTSGENFILYRRLVGSGPIVTTGLTSVTIAWSGSTYGNYVFLEFRGNNLYSIPGEYYVMVRGTNAFGGNENVQFNIVVRVDGPGDMLANLIVIAGILVISIVGLIWLYSIFYNKDGGEKDAKR
ncbi:MAG: hypothetical protein GF317_14620 [Candidatus Lokiarchaeota archaeon]|nr:hypothetical protein [Candidatus Lokiarchaeota archaeon]MBD3200841.1 hypothetical protein [Candidatus Lokiarchaeota archaeon]